MMNKAGLYKLHRRITSLTLAVVMGVSVISAPAYAEAEEVKTAIEVEDETALMEVQSVEVSRFAALKGRIKHQISQQISSDEDSETVVDDRNWQLYRSTYVFDQMNAEEKALYNELENVCNDYAKNSEKDAIYLTDTSGNGAYYLPAVSVKDFDGNDYVKVLQLFIYSNPQFYFTTSSFAKSGNNVYMYCYPAFADGEDRAVITNALFSKLDSWIDIIKSDNETTADIEKYAHDFLCDKLSYDYDAADSMNQGDYSDDVYYCQSIYSAVNNYKTVCAGYALTYELLMNAAGVDTVTVFSDYHAWNKVNLGNDKWYALDVTWDDYGDASKIDYTFFNKSDEEIQKYDDDLPVHVAKTPEYYPVAAYNYEAEETTGDDQSAENIINNDDLIIDTNDVENNTISDESSDGTDENISDDFNTEDYEHDDGIDVVSDSEKSDTEIENVEASGEEITDEGDSDTEIDDVEASGEEITNEDMADTEIDDVEAANKETTDEQATDTKSENTETSNIEKKNADAAIEDTISTEVGNTEADKTDALTMDIVDNAADNSTGNSIGDVAYNSVNDNVETANEYEVKLAHSKITKVKADRKKIRVTWKKIKSIDGYEIQLSKTKNFKKIARTVKASKSATKIWVKKLKKNTTYYVRIRTYKKIDGSKITSDWSGVKKVTTR
ncbi:MAG: fibronectin type III domain-containing protein [Lachnospiraceae bacterium]|nr:fibronectin type III domain-containing protein [Lachnospiraceae bacterium]